MKAQNVHMRCGEYERIFLVGGSPPKNPRPAPSLSSLVRIASQRSCRLAVASVLTAGVAVWTSCADESASMREILRGRAVVTPVLMRSFWTSSDRMVDSVVTP